MSRIAAALAMFAATAGGLAATAAHATIGGVITNASTGAAPVADAFVRLTRCSHDGNELCDQEVAFTVSSNGRYRFNGNYGPGRYQVNVTAEGFLASNPAPFLQVGNEDRREDIALAALPVRHADLQRCEAVDADGLCEVSFKLKNLSSEPQDLDSWVVVATTADAPAGWSRFAFGDRKPSAKRVQLAAGAETTVVQRVYVGKDLPAGAYATLELYVSEHGAPDRTLVFDYTPALIIGAEGQVTAARPADMTARQREHQARSVSLRAASKNQPAGRKDSVLVEVTDAATGEPLSTDVAPKFRLMACDQPTDTYCRWIEGDEVNLSASGVMVVDTKGMFPGRYQIQTRAGDNYAYTYSETFMVPLAAPMKIEMPMKRTPIAIDGVQTCSDQPLENCVLSYRLRNTTAETQRAALWLYDYMLSSQSSVGASVYSLGRGGKANALPVTVTIAPGASVTVKQPIGMQSVATGSSGWLQLYIADLRDPAYAVGFYRLGNYSIYQDGGQKRVDIVPFPF